MEKEKKTKTSSQRKRKHVHPPPRKRGGQREGQPLFPDPIQQRCELSFTRKRSKFFEEATEYILSLQIDHRVNALGGYGPNGEVIYEAHPVGCPSTLVDSQPNATATFTSNGSLDFVCKLKDGTDVHILDGSFDTVEKRETGVPSSNVWLAVSLDDKERVASIVNPSLNVNLAPAETKVVKLGDPERAMWYCASFKPAGGTQIATAVRLSLTHTAQGPAITREIYVKNCGDRVIQGSLWTYFNLHSTQRFVYNKDLWYDAGLPLSNTETVTVAKMPYEDVLQIKRVSSATENATARAASATTPRSSATQPPPPFYRKRCARDI